VERRARGKQQVKNQNPPVTSVIDLGHALKSDIEFQQELKRRFCSKVMTAPKPKWKPAEE